MKQENYLFIVTDSTEAGTGGGWSITSHPQCCN